MGLTWPATTGVGRGHQIDHTSTMNPVKRRFFIFFCLYTIQIILSKTSLFSFAPLQLSSQKIFLGTKILEKHLPPPASQLVYVAKEGVLLFRHILHLYLYVAPLFLKLLVWLLCFQTLLCSQATASLWRMYYYISHYEHISFKAPQTDQNAKKSTETSDYGSQNVTKIIGNFPKNSPLKNSGYLEEPYIKSRRLWVRQSQTKYRICSRNFRPRVFCAPQFLKDDFGFIFAPRISRTIVLFIYQ